MGLSRQEYWSGLPFPSLRDLPNPGIETSSPALQADSIPPEPPEASPASAGCDLVDDGHTDREALPSARCNHNSRGAQKFTELGRVERD